MAPVTLFSTRELARMCGVSESTIKRWADEGLLACIKTPGGHRKFTLDALVEFAQAHNFRLESMGDLKDRERVAVSVEHLLRARSATPLHEALLQAVRTGDGFTAQHLLRRAIEADYELVALIDEVITPVMTEVGRLWATGEMTIDEEHRASGIILDAISEFRIRQSPRQDDAPLALGACGPHEDHVLALKLLLTMLAYEGWRIIDLGADTPFESILHMASMSRPQLVLVSATSMGDVDGYLLGFNHLAQNLKTLGIPLYLGGTALTPGLRRRLKATAFPSNAAALRDLALALIAPATTA